MRTILGAAAVVATVSLDIENPDSSTDANTLSRTAKQDVAFAYAMAAGVDIGITNSLLLDIGVGMHGTGPVSYYGRGRLPDGSVTSLAGPFHSPTRMYALTVGIRWR